MPVPTTVREHIVSTVPRTSLAILASLGALIIFAFLLAFYVAGWYYAILNVPPIQKESAFGGVFLFGIGTLLQAIFLLAGPVICVMLHLAINGGRFAASVGSFIAGVLAFLVGLFFWLILLDVWTKTYMQHVLHFPPYFNILH